MNRLKGLLINLWNIEQLERRIAVLEGELSFRVTKLEGELAAMEANRETAARLLSHETRARNADMRLEYAIQALVTPSWFYHMKQLQNLQNGQGNRQASHRNQNNILS